MQRAAHVLEATKDLRSLHHPVVPLALGFLREAPALAVIELAGAHVAAGGGAGREGGERDEAGRRHGGADVCGQGLGKAKSCLLSRRCARGQPKLGLGEAGNSDEVLLVQLVSSSVVRRGRRAAHWRCWDYLRAAPMICKPGELASVLLNASYCPGLRSRFAAFLLASLQNRV